MYRVILGALVCGSLLVSAPAARGATYLVTPDGTGDFPTIQAAINAAVNGDVIELADGTFRGDGNRNVSFAGKAVTVCSHSGDPWSCILDVEGVHDETAYRAFFFDANEGHDTVIRDLTIINGVASGG